ncbi:MAG: acylphosphatase [Chloroflexi bacterium]|nr:acylphosphatase [Chloroflexota bacterium]
MSRVRAHVLVSGLVQGVFFRDSLRAVANRHGVTGWVRNTFDGAVEAVLEGEQDDVQQVVEWSRRGPPGADVTDVDVTWGNYAGEFPSFSIRR